MICTDVVLEFKFEFSDEKQNFASCLPKAVC